MSTAYRLRFAALTATVVLAACGSPQSKASASHSPTPEPSVSSASLLAYTARGSDLGPGWTDSPDSSAASLDVDNESHPCHQAYGSDFKRLAVNGVSIKNATDPSQVSNDVTFYRAKGAEDALKDVRRVLASCTNYTQLNNEGHVVMIEVHESSANFSQLGDDRVVFDRKASIDNRSIYGVVITVRIGRYLSTVYTVSGDPAEAGRLAGLASAASTIRLKAAPAS